jgi:threonylcarbamoyladenosine tRNA methylthiotransferase MtaB
VATVARLKAARPDIAIGADLIAGFPTEDEAMFADTLALIDDAEIVHGHIFPYSPRAGTPAARMPQVAAAAIRARAERLRGTAARRKAAWLAAQVGSVQQVLLERPGDRGHAGNFAEVRLSPFPVRAEPVEALLSTSVTPAEGSSSTGSGRTGMIAELRITAATDTHLLGTMI